ncbi:MAG: TonB-dependent receptor [Armatimonadota bacterium]|nr:TonB-dependent receptor [Armatimonadota bacterium]MDR7557468.1 TonB-dependent receptor [Armatimonadota bacterium]MDR7571584.1 TonB-dependent receptor [Armatimonadota bacterium]
MRFWTVLVLLSCLVAPAVAQPLPPPPPPGPSPQEPSEPPVFELPEVVVPGRRPQPGGATPASVTVITRAELERIGARTVADALRLVPEAVVRAYGGYGSLAEASLRGFGPGQVLVLVDGVPVNSIALGQADLSTVSAAGVERIEILRGAFGAIAGSGAVGGVINIVMSAGEAPSVQMRAGGYGERQFVVRTGGRGAGLTIESAASAGARPNSDVTALTVAARAAVGGARINLHHSQSDLGTPGDVAFPTPQDRQAFSRTLVQAQWGGAASPARGRAYALTEFLRFTSPFGSSTYNSTVVGAEVQRQWEIGPGRVVVGGLEGQRQALEAAVFGSPIAQQATLGAGYLQYDAVLSRRALASTALRLDAHSAYGLTLNPRAGIVVAIDETTRIRAGVGRTFRGPTFLHLYFPGCSNPALRPETAWTAEVSVERSSAVRVTTVTAFQSEAADLIAGGCPPVNIGAARISGLSAEVRGRLGDAWTARMHLTALQGVDRTTGEPLIRVPSLTAGAVLTRRLGDTSALTLMAQYVGPRPDLDFSVFPAVRIELPGYLDLGLRYRTETSAGWTVTFGVDNLPDASYEVVKGYPVPGRTVFVAASRRF